MDMAFGSVGVDGGRGDEWDASWRRARGVPASGVVTIDAILEIGSGSLLENGYEVVSRCVLC
jgi:hypothetical protein